MRINHIKNPSFEGGLTYWTSTNHTQTQHFGSYFHNGTHSMRLQRTGGASSYTYTSTDFGTITPGVTYTASAYFYLPFAVATTYYFIANVYNASGGIVGNYTASSTLQAGTSGWARRSVTFTAPAGSSYAVIYAPYAITAGATSDVIYVDGVMVEEGPLADYFDGDTVGYEWEGTPYASRSVEIEPPSLSTDVNVRLEVSQDGITWLDITGPTKTITTTRKDSDVGLMNAEVLDVDLDPITASTLRPGRKVRVRAANDSEWDPIFTGLIDNVDVDYDPLAPVGKTTNVKISAVDNVSYLANQKEPRGAGTIDSLRALVAGLSFNINGQTTGITEFEPVAMNENASLWDQILITRDSNLGYAWVDKNNHLQVQDPDHIDDAQKAVFGPTNYNNLVLDFNLSQVINSVTVNWRRYDIGTETAADVPYGPYEDDDSIAEWGRRSATFTIQGETEVESNIEDFASEVLSRNAVAQIRPSVATVIVHDETTLAMARDLDLNNRVKVVYTDGITEKMMRVVGITQTITPQRWSVEFEFAVTDSLTQPSQTPGTGIGVTPPGSIGEVDLDPGILEDLADAKQDAQDAITAAVEAMDIATTRNSVYYQTSKPTGGTYLDGDLWFDEDDGNKMYIYDDSVNDFVVATVSHLITPNGRLVIDTNGLVGYDGSGNIKLAMDAGTGTLTLNGPVTSGGVITGASITSSGTGVIQTTSTANRGIKLNNAGMVVYSNTGAAVMTIDGATGAIAMTGGIVSGATIEASSLTTANSGARVVIGSPSGGGPNNEIEFDLGNGKTPGRIANELLGTTAALTFWSPSGSPFSDTGYMSLQSTSGGSTSVVMNADLVDLASGTEFSFGYGPTHKGFNKGGVNQSTNGSGQVTVSHGLSTTPASVNVTPSSAHQILTVSSFTSSSFTVTVRNEAGNTVNSSNTIFYWQAWA